MAVEKISIDIDSNSKEVQKELSKVNTQLKKLQKQLPGIQKNVEKLKQAEKSVKAINNQLKKLSTQKAKLQTDTSQLDYTAKKISNVTLQMNRLQARKVKLLVSIDQLLHAEAVLIKLNRELDYLNGRKAVLHIEMDGVQQAISEIDRLSEKMQQLGALQSISLPSIKGEISMNIQTKMDFDMSVLTSKVEELKSLKEISISIQTASKHIEKIEKNVPSNLDSMLSKLLAMGAAIVGMGLLVGIAGALVVTFPLAALAGFATIKLIGVLLEETAKTMELIDAKVPSDFGSMVSKLASMGIALLGMGALVALAGGLSAKFSDQATAGLEMIKEIIGLLGETAEAMEVINEKVPSDLGSMVSKLASMGIAILGMGALVVIADLVATEFKGAKAGIELISEITDLLGKAAEAMGEISSKISSDLGSMVSKLASMGIAILGMGALVVIADVVATKFKGAKAGLELISEITTLLGKAADAMGKIDKKVPSGFGSMIDKLGNMGIAILGMGALVVIAGAVATKFKGTKTGLELISGITDLLGKAADALGQIDKKVPRDIGKVAEKLGSIGVAIGGMSVLVGVVGALTSSGIGALIAGAGLATVYAVAEELIHTSEAIAQLDKNVPEDIDGVKTKIENIAKAIGYFTQSSLASAFDLFKSAMGTINTAVAAEGILKLIEVGQELKKFDEITIPDDIEAKINDIQAVFEYLKKGVGIFGEIKKFFLGGNIDTDIGEDAKLAIENLVSLAESLDELGTAEIKDADTIGEQIENIQSVFGILEKTKGFKDDIERLFKGGDINTTLADDAKVYVESIAAIATAFETIQTTNFKSDRVARMIEEIQKVFDVFLTKGNAVERFTSMFTGKNKINTSLVKDAKNYVSDLSSIATELSKIQDTSLRVTDIKEKLLEIQDVVKEFSKIKIEIDMDETSLTKSVDKVTLVNDLITQLEQALDFTFDEGSLTTFKQTLENVSLAVQEIIAMDFINNDENSAASDPVDVGEEIFDFTKMQLMLEMAIIKITKINDLGEQLSTALELHFDDTKLNDFEIFMENISTAIQEILEKDFTSVNAIQTPTGKDLRVGGDATPSWEDMEKLVQEAIDKLTKINDLGEQLSIALDFKFDSSKLKEFEQTMSNMASAVETIRLADFSPQKIITQTHMNVPDESGVRTTETTTETPDYTTFEQQVDDAIEKVTKIGGLTTEIDNVMKTTIDPKAFELLLTNTKNCLGQINSFVADTGEIGDVESILLKVEAFKTLVDTLNGLVAKFGKLGTDYGQQLLFAFNLVNPAGAIEYQFSNVIAYLQGEMGTFKTIGDAYTKNLTETLLTAIGSISDKMKSVVDTLSANGEGSISSKFNSAGQAFGNSFVNGFALAIEGLGKTVKEELESIGFSVSVSSSTGGENEIPDLQNKATGGLVAGRVPLSSLSGIFKRKGTDTVPAMLTPGEFVQRRSAVSAFGVDFMKRVNNLDVQGAFTAMTSRFGFQGLTPAVSTIVNNINHTTNNANRVTQNVNSGNADYILKRASRYLR